MFEVFMTKKGPQAVGPYSTAVEYGNLVFMSGMIPIDPATKALVPGGITEQAHRAFQNVAIVLEEMGLSMQNALKVSVFLQDLNDFKVVNEIYATYFGPNYPARSCLQVAALPMGALIEVEVTAEKPV